MKLVRLFVDLLSMEVSHESWGCSEVITLVSYRFVHLKLFAKVTSRWMQSKMALWV